jgi:hypothetical protein
MKKRIFIVGVVFLFAFLTSCIGQSSQMTINNTSTSLIQSETSIIPQNISFYSTTTPATSTEPSPNISKIPSLLLPYRLYYIGYSYQLKNYQIFRFERDGITNSQVTNDSDGIISFDIIQNSIGIIYLDNKHNLKLTDIQGRITKIMVPNINSESPALSWSPDGKTIAYQNGGIVFYSLKSNTSNLILKNIDDKWVYSPRSFSPDGSMLMVASGCRYAFYNIAYKILTLLDSPSNDADYSCGGTQTWSPDSKNMFIADGDLAGGKEGMRLPGLWRYTTDGKGVNLLPSPFINNKYMYNKAIASWVDINTGDLFFLFSPPDTGVDNPLIPYSLVHSDPDAVTNRIVLRPETFHPATFHQTLWAPDGSFLIIVQYGEKTIYSDMILVPTDPNRPIITLMSDASSFAGNLRWGP